MGHVNRMAFIVNISNRKKTVNYILDWPFPAGLFFSSSYSLCVVCSLDQRIQTGKRLNLTAHFNCNGELDLTVIAVFIF